MTMTVIDDLDTINVHQHTKFGDPNPNSSKDMIFFLANYLLVTFGLVVTNRRTDRQEVTHKSP